MLWHRWCRRSLMLHWLDAVMEVESCKPVAIETAFYSNPLTPTVVHSYIASCAGPGTAAPAPPPFRLSDPALCGSCPLVTPYYCRLGDLLCLFCVYRFVCTLLFSSFSLSFVDLPSVLWYCWLGLLTCKNRLPYNLYCVGGDVKHCSLTPDRVKLSFVIFDIQTLWLWVSEYPDVKNYKWRSGIGCTHMATMGVKGISHLRSVSETAIEQ